MTAARIARREVDVQWILGRLEDLREELESVPAHARAAPWYRDRLVERIRLVGQLERIAPTVN